MHSRQVPLPKSNIPVERLKAALETDVLRLREEQEWTSELTQRATVARRIIEDCDREHAESTKRQAALSHTIAQYQDLLALIGSPAATGMAALAKSKLVARLGAQHYRMLHALRDNGPMGLDDLARASIASPRRVRVQMAEDSQAERRIVAINNGLYELTPTGVDLLRRFEEFRRSTGQDLPSLDAPPSDADRDEADPETPNCGDEG